MSLAKTEREKIQKDMLKQIHWDNFSAAKIAVKHGVSPQTIYRYLQELQKQRIIEPSGGEGKKKKYNLVCQVQNIIYLNNGLREGEIWKQDVAPFYKDVPRIAYNKLEYIFTEMMNNAIEHSGGEEIEILLFKTHISAAIFIMDNGVGIFRKIQDSLGLTEKSFAILELVKGKLTTAPENHTGEGIFFSSRIADSFDIFSDELAFIAHPKDGAGDTLYNNMTSLERGTLVIFVVFFDNNTAINDVFHLFTEHPEHIGFNATLVPVRLLEYGAENPIFVSRSEARRLLARFERFSRITLDFAGVEAIRQGFADEVFRVFPNAHPDCKIEVVNCNGQVQTMIEHVKNTK